MKLLKKYKTAPEPATANQTQVGNNNSVCSINHVNMIKPVVFELRECNAVDDLADLVYRR